MSTRLTVVCFSSQEGAREETFDVERFANEVTIPIRDLLAPPCVVNRFLIVTLSAAECAHGEIFARHPLSEDGTPPRLTSPTSDAVRTYLRGPVREGKIGFLNIDLLNEESGVEYAINFAFGGGAERVIVFRHGVRLPSRGLLRFLYDKMLSDQRRVLVCQNPENTLTPA